MEGFKRLLVFGLALGFALIPRPAFALKFTNQFVEFELPYKWNCSLVEAEWVCQSLDDQKKRDAIIVLAAKLKGDQDTLDKYQEYLAKPRVFTSAGPNPKAITSQPKTTEIKQINQHPWVVSLHLESELPGFYTRYFATVKQDIGVLVTYSINKNKYQEYSQVFDDMVKSLKVFRKSGGGINTAGGQSIFAQTQLPGSFTQQGVFGDASSGASGGGSAAKPKSQEDDSLTYLLLLGAAGIGFVIYKKRKSGGA